ncbi:hypothetical protein, partial [Pseudomonas sp. Pseusp97]|uniref:hypothetical protein n=1 Tax=Pseudomonas sp. Pseusp97 TaxID=3243065 RepID=UPI0039A6C2C2
SMRIILVTQDLQQLAAFALTLIEQTFRMTKLTKKNYRVDIYTGAAKGERPPKAQRIRQTYGQFSEDIHRYYKSATMSETGDVGDESKADKRGNAFRSPFVWLAVAGVLYCAVSGVSGLFEYFNPTTHEGVNQGESESAAPKPAELVNPMPVAAPVASSAVVSTTAKPSGPPVSETWRVAGWLGCTMPASDDSDATVRPCGASEQGGLKVSRTSGVVLAGPGADRRIVPMETCWWLQRDRYIACSVDGAIANPWSGRSAAAATAVSMTGSQSSAAGERSDPAALDATRSSSAHASASVDRQPVAVTIVPDSEYSSRPWR